MTSMSKIPVRMFRHPTLTLVGQPWRPGEDEKLFWVNFSFDGLPFVLDELAVLETGRTLKGRNFQAAPDGNSSFPPLKSRFNMPSKSGSVMKGTPS